MLNMLYGTRCSATSRHSWYARRLAQINLADTTLCRQLNLKHADDVCA